MESSFAILESIIFSLSNCLILRVSMTFSHALESSHSFKPSSWNSSRSSLVNKDRLDKIVLPKFRTGNMF